MEGFSEGEFVMRFVVLRKLGQELELVCGDVFRGARFDRVVLRGGRGLAVLLRFHVVL